MKRLFLPLFAFILILPVSVYAKAPKIQVPESIFKYNNTIEGKDIVHSFKVNNTGDEILKIARVKARG